MYHISACGCRCFTEWWALTCCVPNRPLPHERIRQGWRPSGDPVYARTCLVFPKHEQHCRVGKFVPLPTCTATMFGEQLVCSCCACVDVRLARCVAVFGMLLGDTVILNTLDDANSYRQEVRVCATAIARYSCGKSRRSGRCTCI